MTLNDLELRARALLRRNRVEQELEDLDHGGALLLAVDVDQHGIGGA